MERVVGVGVVGRVRVRVLEGGKGVEIVAVVDRVRVRDGVGC